MLNNKNAQYEHKKFFETFPAQPGVGKDIASTYSGVFMFGADDAQKKEVVVRSFMGLTATGNVQKWLLPLVLRQKICHRPYLNMQPKLGLRMYVKIGENALVLGANQS